MRHSAIIRTAAAVAFTLAAIMTQPALAQSKEVRVYNWSDYIDPAIIEDFQKETGIKVIYDTYDSNDILETKMLAGKTGYDVIAPTNNYLARLIQANVLAKLDKGKLPNLRHMDGELMGRLAKYDPGNQHAVIYMWGTTGIGLNADKVRARIKNPPANSLAMIFDPAIVSKFADCGVNLLDAPDEMIPAALKWVGEDPNSKDPRALAKAEEAFMKIRPYIRKFHSSQYINDLANGDSCLAFGWSGDILQAKTRAEEAKNGVKVQYLVPKEGALQWFDSFAVPADAPNADNAHVFINYMMRPAVIAKATNFVQYPNGNKDSLRLIDKEAKADKDVFPTPEMIRTLYTLNPNNQAQQRVFTRIWTKIKGAS